MAEEPQRRVLYSGSSSNGTVDETYLKNINAANLFPVVDSSPSASRSSSQHPPRVDQEMESKDLDPHGDRQEPIRLQIPGNTSAINPQDAGEDGYLAMLSQCTNYAETHLAPPDSLDKNHSIFDDVDVEQVTPAPPSPSNSSNLRASQSTPFSPIVITTPEPAERILIVKQQTESWGDYQIDKYGRIITSPVRAQDLSLSLPTPTHTLPMPSNSTNSNSNCVNPNSTPSSTPIADVSPRRPSMSTSTAKASTSTKPSAATAQASVLKQQAFFRQRELTREQKWVDMLENWDFYVKKKEAVLKRRIRKGIPGSMRGAVWPKLLDLETAKQSKPPMYYYDLLQQDINPADDKQIRKDLPRLMQDHVMFKSPEAGSRTVMCTGQALLYHVLRAYSVHDPKVGYVQGMDSIAAPALLYFPEETAFWYLERLLNSPRFGLRYLYVDHMPLAHQYVYTHTQLLQRHLPAVAKLLEKHGIEPYSYAFRWYSMRYAQFSPDLAYRVMDVYLYEGDKILYRVALALIAKHQKRMFQVAKSNPEELLHVLSSIEHDHEGHSGTNADILMESACDMKLTTAEISKITDQYVLDNPQ